MSVADARASRFVQAPGDEAAAIGVREMVAIANKHRWKIAAALLLPPLLALALVFLLPKSYRAGSDIMVKTGREYLAQGDGESVSLTAPSSTKQEGINSEVALLTSRAVAEATIAEIGLDVLYPNIVANPPSSGTPLDAAVLQFGRDLGVEPVKLSNVISVTFDAESPALARRVLDTVVRVYIDTHTRVFAARRADGYRDSIDKALAEIGALEQHRTALRLQSGLYDADTQRRAVIAQRSDAIGRLEDARSRQARLSARLAYLGKARGQAPATALLTSVERSDAQSHAAEALVDLHQQEAALRDRLGNSNPDLQRIRAQIDAVGHAAGSARKERNATTGPSSLRTQIEADLVTTGADLAGTGREIDRWTDFVATRDADLAQIERGDLALRDAGLQIDMMTQNLKAMQGRYEQARADEQTEIARQVSVVQVAGALGSEKPVAPRKWLFAAAGVLGGILLAGIVALLAILTSKTALTGDAAERRVGLPVLAVVPLYADDADDMAYGAP